MSAFMTADIIDSQKLSTSASCVNQYVHYAATQTPEVQAESDTNTAPCMKPPFAFAADPAEITHPRSCPREVHLQPFISCLQSKISSSIDNTIAPAPGP